MPQPPPALIKAQIAAVQAEIAALDYPMELAFAPETAFMLTALVQLALRHPGVTGELRTLGETFLGAVRLYFADAPAVLQVLEQGDDPAFDFFPGTVQ